MTRSRFDRGELHPQAKLKEREVIELRAKWENLRNNLLNDNEPLKGYKYRFCNFHCNRTSVPVSWSTIWWAISRLDWKYIEEENK